MTKIRFKGFDKAQKQSKQKILNAITNPKFLQAVGDKALANMKQDLRLGKDPVTRKRHSAPLKQSTITKRQKMAKKNKVSAFYKKSRALVFTGELIESLAYKIRSGRQFIEFIAKGTHKPYSGSKQTISNQRLLEIHNKGEGQKKRRMIGLHEQSKRSVIEETRKVLRRLLRK